jgi:hypothetical protein
MKSAYRTLLLDSFLNHNISLNLVFDGIDQDIATKPVNPSISHARRNRSLTDVYMI